MNLLIGISGSHGSGKSTLITELCDQQKYREDKLKISRFIQSSIFNASNLDSIIADPITMVSFQEMILRIRTETNIQIKETKSFLKKITISERTPADISVYAYHWAQKNMDNLIIQNWIKSYENSCKNQMDIYDLIIYIPPIIPFVSDENRAPIENRDSVDIGIKEFISKHAKKWYELKSSSVEDRVQEASSIISNMECRNHINETEFEEHYG